MYLGTMQRGSNREHEPAAPAPPRNPMRALWLLPEAQPGFGLEPEDEEETDMEIGALILSESASLRVAAQVHRCQTWMLHIRDQIALHHCAVLEPFNVAAFRKLLPVDTASGEFAALPPTRARTCADTLSQLIGDVNRTTGGFKLHYSQLVRITEEPFHRSSELDALFPLHNDERMDCIAAVPGNRGFTFEVRPDPRLVKRAIGMEANLPPHVRAG
jgi:hypothetical protein